MVQTVESRSLFLGSGIPNLHICTAHLPDGASASDFLKRYVSGDGSVVPYEKLGRAIMSLPLDPFPDRGPNLRHLDPDIFQYLLVHLLSTPMPTIEAQYRQDHGPGLIRELREKGAPSFPLEAEHTANLALAYGAALNAYELIFIHELWRTIKSYEVSFSHSPELGSITLSKLIEGGVRSACVVPLITGVHSAIQSQVAGHFAVAFEATLVGSGVTLVALSSLWLADRILTGLRSHEFGDKGTGRDHYVNEVRQRREREEEAEQLRHDREKWANADKTPYDLQGRYEDDAAANRADVGTDLRGQHRTGRNHGES